MSVISDFILPRLISHSFTLEVIKFRAATYYSWLFKNTGQFCLGFGYSTEDIALEIRTQLQLVECNKKLIADLGRPWSAWTSMDSYFIDECPLSSTGGEITL